VSIGVAELAAGEEPEDLFVRADAQLYAAKGAGRNCVRPC
jgi:PleD family two-component response regulator